METSRQRSWIVRKGCLGLIILGSLVILWAVAAPFMIWPTLRWEYRPGNWGIPPPRIRIEYWHTRLSIEANTLEPLVAEHKVGGECCFWWTLPRMEGGVPHMKRILNISCLARLGVYGGTSLVVIGSSSLYFLRRRRGTQRTMEARPR